MNTVERFLSDLSSAGVVVTHSAGRIFYWPRGNVPDHQQGKIAKLKASIIGHLKGIDTLEVGRSIGTPEGAGAIWEIYPSLLRVGVLLGACAPQFFDIDETWSLPRVEFLERRLKLLRHVIAHAPTSVGPLGYESNWVVGDIERQSLHLKQNRRAA